MNRQAFYPNRLGRRTAALAVAASGVALIVPQVRSEPSENGPTPMVRIEEDWKLIVNEPDETVDSPQFHTVISPYGDLDANNAMVLWNYRELFGEDFHPGGVQLHSIFRDDVLRSRVVEQRQLSTTAESITWTQALQTDGDILSFEIIDGNSTTWGWFGRDMRIDEDTDLVDLSAYDPSVSVENSCVTYGSNRVDKLVITEVRYFGPDDELLAVDSAEHVAYEYESSEE